MFSIIIPVYNCEKYIENCINSVIRQTFKNFELILVMDGIVDNSYDICKEISTRDNRIKVIYKEHSGVSATRNLGLKNATGTYVIFLDSDDELFDKYVLERIYKRCLSNEYDIYIYDYIDNKGRKYINNTKSFNEICDLAFIEDSLQENLKIPATVWRCVFKRDIIKDTLFNEEYKYGEDIDYIFRCVCLAYNIQYVNEFIVIYNLSNKNSITQNAKIADLKKYIEFLNSYYMLAQEKGYQKMKLYLSGRYCKMIVRVYLMQEIDEQYIEEKLINTNIMNTANGIIYNATRLIWRIFGYRLGSKIIGNIFLLIKR